jgi:hypothetical protein
LSKVAASGADTTFAIVSNTDVNVTAAGELFSEGMISVGDGSQGTLSVDGVDSKATALGDTNSTFAANGGTADVSFTSGAIGSLEGGLEMAVSNVAGTSATLDVLSGADVSLHGKLSMATSGGATTSAILNIQGADSRVRLFNLAKLAVGHSLTGTATINIGTTESGATFSTSSGLAEINPTGIVNVGAGANTGTLNVNGDMDVDGGLLAVGAGSSVVVDAGNTMTLENSGTLAGSGTVTGNVVNTSGVVEPGTSPGDLTINGDYSQSASGALAIDLAGTTLGSDYDRLLVSGHAALAGTLDVSLVSFVPQLNDQFDILNWSTQSGTFGMLDLPSLTTGLVWDIGQLYTDGVLEVVSGLAGDYNGNEEIDAADYTVWRDALTAASTSLANDPTPGTVDESDFLYWRTHYGESLGSGSGSAAAVPEPNTLAMLFLGSLLSLAVRRRKVVVST